MHRPSRSHTPPEPHAPGRRLRAARVAGALAIALLAGLAHAGGSGERTLLIIDPTSAESLHVGNHYRSARDIPAANVLYYAHASGTYQQFVDRNLAALFATIAERDTFRQIDTIVLTPAGADGPFFTAAPGLVNDACSPVSRFSVTGAYYTARLSSQLLAGGVPVTRQNEYARAVVTPLAFSGSRTYSNGLIGNGEAYFITALLGYTGERGNTRQEIIDLIDRSVAADFSSPTGTFYFQQTSDAARSSPRDGAYQAVANAIVALGGQAERRVNEVLPLGETDAMGIMTGWPTPDIGNQSLALVPGAFADHLTSFAAAFDVGAQTKASRWITKGASGTWGCVQEPCNYSGKFPSPWLHAQYFQGLSLGEAAMRSATFLPFQGLLLGDPLTQPFAVRPDVAIAGLPTELNAAVAIFTAPASTAKPGASIGEVELYLNGVLQQGFPAGSPLFFSAATLSDGWHEVRVVAREAGAIETRGSASASFVRTVGGRSIEAMPSASAGDLATAIDIALTAPDDALETRITQHGRVVAATPVCGGTLRVHGSMLGAGTSLLVAEAVLPDGSIVRSAPFEIEIANTGATTPTEPPRAFDFVRFVTPGQPAVVNLPAGYGGDPGDLAFTLLDAPASATIEPGTAPYRLVEVDASAAGLERIRYEVAGPTGTSVGSLTLIYNPLLLDRTGDGRVDIEDLYTQSSDPADVDQDGDIDADDAALIERVIRCSEPLLRR